MKIFRGLQWLWSVLVLAFLILPILVVIPLSFSTGSFLSYPLPGVGLRWYQAFLESDFWLLSLYNSALIGVCATIGATVLGTLAAIGLWRGRFAGQRLVMALLMTPMVVPAIITAVALTFAFAPVGLSNTYTGLIIAHIALASPFVVVTVLASLMQFDAGLLRAAYACGATPTRGFFSIMLPGILPGVVAGAVFAMAISLDESVVVLFLASPEQRTLPRQMFAGLKDTIELTILAAATMLVVLSAVLMGLSQLLRRKS